MCAIKNKQPYLVYMETIESLSPLLTVAEVAALLRFNPETIREMIRKGKLPAIKVGRTWRVQLQEIEKFLGPRNPLEQQENIAKYSIADTASVDTSS